MQIHLTPPVEVTTALAALDPDRILEHTQQLCSPSFAGRRVGTEGHARASSFLAQQLRDAGWNVATQEFLLSAPVLEQHAPSR
jgi:aminopeptidase YwaD